MFGLLFKSLFNLQYCQSILEVEKGNYGISELMKTYLTRPTEILDVLRGC